MVSSLALSIVILLLTVVTCFLSHNISPVSKIPHFQLFKKSEIEEALVRIKGMEGVEGYVICNNDGTVLRHQVDMTKKVADDLARVSLFYWIFRIVQRMQCCKFLLLLLHTTRLAHGHLLFSQRTIQLNKNLTKLASRATNVTRDLDPNDDLRILRIKTGRKEIIVSHERDFIVVVLQEWRPKSDQD